MQIVLIGFQGAGKTTIGRVLAERLRIPFCDLDEAIVQKLGAESIRHAFMELGERRFREVEAEVAAQLMGQNQGIIAFGGGALSPLAHVPHGVHVLYLFQNVGRICRSVDTSPLWIYPNTLQQRWEERHPVFTRYATEIISLGYSSIEEDVWRVMGLVRSFV